MGNALFDLEDVFEVDDYLFAYQDDLTDERTDKEVVSVVDLLNLHPPLRILDLACGFGRHANRLAALGYSVTGVDYMSGFLSLAQKQASEMGVQVDYRQADMREIDFHKEFDVALLLFTSFGFFEDNENELVIRNMLHSLKPGGRLVLDIPNRDIFPGKLPPAGVIEKSDGLLINRYSFDPETGRLHNGRIVIRNGVRKDKPYYVRLYNATEIRNLLDQAGFVDCKILGENYQPLSINSRKMIVSATKPR